MMLRLALAILGLLPAALGFVAAALIARRRPGGGWARAAAASGVAALSILFATLLLRGMDYLGGGAGPQAFFQTAGPPSAMGVATAALKLQACLSGLFALILVGMTAVRGSRPLPAGDADGALARLLPLLGLVAGVVSFGVLVAAPLSVEPLLDVAVVAPLLGFALALAAAAPSLTRADKTMDEAAASPPAATVPAPVLTPDAEALLRRAGLLTMAEPDFAFPKTAARAEPPPGGESSTLGPSEAALATIWECCGGAGAPPEALRQLLELRAPAEAGDRSRGRWVGSLPAETLTAVESAVLVGALAGQGGRVLCVSPEPEAVAQNVERSLARMGLSRAGAFVVGTGALKDTLAAGILPALVCLNVHELSGEALKALSRSSPGLGFLALLDKILLVRVEGLLPIESTHLALALRRLALLTATELGEGRAVRWLALCEGGSTGRRYLEQAVGRSFDELALGATTTAAARVFLRRLPRKAAGGAAIGEELLSWGRTLRGAGVPLQLEDPSAELGEAARSLIDGPAQLHRTPGYHGAASLALCDERHLAQLYRAGSNLAHSGLRKSAAPGQLSVAWVKESPLARFLTQRGTLAALSTRGELPTPRPLSGTDNAFLAAAHLEAALDEGLPDEAELRHAFSGAAVDELLAARKDVQRVGVRARWNAETRHVTRSALLSRPGSPLPEQRRQTVTLNVVEVRSRHDGALLGRVDRRIAATRYYPHRVFGQSGRLHQVVEAALTPAATSILVGPAPPGSLPTVPLLETRVEATGFLGEIERHRFDKLSFARAVAAINVHEAVSGVIPRGTAEPSVRYQAVEARYNSTALVLLFEKVGSEAALHHLARVIDLLLPAHLVVEDEDVEVLALAAGIGEIARPALLFVDRHLGGIGVASAIDAATAHNLLRWAWGVLYSCPCMNGCEQCTPPDVLKRGADKQGVLKLVAG